MNGNNWKDFVDSLHREGGHRNRIKTLDSDMADYLDSGPQKKGGYKNKRARFKGKKFNDVSAPPGAAGGLEEEEEVSADSFNFHEGLEPRLWRDMTLKRVVRTQLLKIANFFMDKLPIEANVEDIRLTGSLANYNWSNYSDVDLHIVVNFLDVDENTELVKAFFDNVRARWNQNHQIQIKGYDVEIYVENMQEQHLSSGVYSILNDEWVERPRKFQSQIDFPAARKKAQDIEFQANVINNLVTAGKFKKASKSVDRLKTKIKNMRRAGLESRKQEFSVENIAFKILRRNGALERLNDLKDRMHDDMMSIEEGPSGALPDK
jgi:mRNA-degrading endonuclease YafQ of YafQ-DinJ toxin-antitoxin module